MSIWEHKHFEGEVRARKCPEALAQWKAEQRQFALDLSQVGSTSAGFLPRIYEKSQRVVSGWWA